MKTIEYLRMYNKWRRGDDSINQPDPKELGEYIEKACNELEEVECAIDMAARAELERDKLREDIKNLLYNEN